MRLTCHFSVSSPPRCHVHVDGWWAIFFGRFHVVSPHRITKLEYGSDVKAFSDHRYKHPYELQPPLPIEPSSSPIEDSWIYTFCIKCRGKDTTPSWEPPMWQKVCPFPLCPTFRQFARLWCIIIIGKRKRAAKPAKNHFHLTFLNVCFRCNCLVYTVFDCW